MKEVKTIVVVDADNTLWDTDKVYAVAQLRLLNSVEAIINVPVPVEDRLRYLRDVDQAIASIHHKGLKYPPALLSYALELVLKGSSPSEAVGKACKSGVDKANVPALDLEKQFLKDLKINPPLRSGVTSGLRELHKYSSKIIVVTEGSQDRCNDLLRHYGLINWIDLVLEGQKRPELYKRIKKLEDDNSVFFMIGDQLDRDIEPAKISGFFTIYYPGGFQPKWSPKVSKIKPDYKISSLEDVPPIIKMIKEKCRVTAT